jgi:release factor glutamine methyltransferase
LNEGGWLLMEMGFGQSDALKDLLSEWSDVTILEDLQAIPRIVKASANRRSLHSATLPSG